MPDGLARLNFASPSLSNRGLRDRQTEFFSSLPNSVWQRRPRNSVSRPSGRAKQSFAEVGSQTEFGNQGPAGACSKVCRLAAGKAERTGIVRESTSSEPGQLSEGLVQVPGTCGPSRKRQRRTSLSVAD